MEISLPCLAKYPRTRGFCSSLPSCCNPSGASEQSSSAGLAKSGSRCARSQISTSNAISFFGTQRASFSRSFGATGRAGSTAARVSNSGDAAGPPVVDCGCIGTPSVPAEFGLVMHPIAATPDTGATVFEDSPLAALTTRS